MLYQISLRIPIYFLSFLCRSLLAKFSANLYFDLLETHLPDEIGEKIHLSQKVIYSVGDFYFSSSFKISGNNSDVEIEFLSEICLFGIYEFFDF